MSNVRLFAAEKDQYFYFARWVLRIRLGQSIRRNRSSDALNSVVNNLVASLPASPLAATDGVNFKTGVAVEFAIEDISTVKHKRWTVHAIVDPGNV